MLFDGVSCYTNETSGFWTGSMQDSGVPDMQAAYASIFGQGLWIIAGSIIAFLLGQLVDVKVFHRIKIFTGEKEFGYVQQEVLLFLN